MNSDRVRGYLRNSDVYKSGGRWCLSNSDEFNHSAYIYIFLPPLKTTSESSIFSVYQTPQKFKHLVFVIILMQLIFNKTKNILRSGTLVDFVTCNLIIVENKLITNKTHVGLLDLIPQAQPT